MENNYVIEARNLTKRYGAFTAVDSLNLHLQRGEVFGLLGPNGAGKTTTILMLLGLTDRSGGEVEVLGFDPARQPLQVKARVGYLPDAVGFYDELTARENLIYIAKLNGIPRAEAYRRVDVAIDRMGLHDAVHQRVATFSRGMRQRLGVAELLLKEPQVIIMDEPTLGLDPEAARQFLQLILTLKEEGITILLSSHLLHQVQAVCDRVGLFHKGRMVLDGPVPQLAQQVMKGAYRVQIEAGGVREELMNALRRVPGVVDVTAESSQKYLLEARSDLRAEAARAVVNAGGSLLNLHVEAPSLDEIYARYFQEVHDVRPA
ncbi:MAG: ABC transporter ATP-binding protein [Caldilineaceae bacterium]